MKREAGALRSRLLFLVVLLATALAAAYVARRVVEPGVPTPVADPLLAAYAGGHGTKVAADGFQAVFPTSPTRTTSTSGAGADRSDVTQYASHTATADFVVIVFRYANAAAVPSDLRGTLRTVASSGHLKVDSVQVRSVHGKRRLTFRLSSGRLKTSGFYAVSGRNLYEVHTVTALDHFTGGSRFFSSFAVLGA